MSPTETIRGWRVGSARVSYPVKDYVYRGDQPYTFPAPGTVRVCARDGCAGTVHAKGLCSTHYRARFREGGEDATDRRRKPFDPTKCGTKGGYKHHMYHGVPVCQPCRDAKNRYERQTYARRMGGGK